MVYHKSKNILACLVVFLLCLLLSSCKFKSSPGNKVVFESKELQTDLVYHMDVFVNKEPSGEIIAELNLLNENDIIDNYQLDYDLIEMGHDYKISFFLT